MYIVSFNLIFNENANILAKRLNIPYIVDFKPVDNDLIIVFGCHDQAINLYVLQQQIKCKYIIIQSEQYESSIFDNKYYIDLLKNNYILDWSKINVERIKKHMNYKVYSFYYYDNFVVESTKERKIDFFFCGAHSPEREQKLTMFKLQNPGFVFEYDFSYNYTNFNELNNKLIDVKYVINLPFYKNNSLETHRINKALSMGCQVISIPSSDLYLNEKYKDFIHFVNDLNDFCPLLEMVPKKSYKEMMMHYGESQIANNIHALQYIEKQHIEKQYVEKQHIENVKSDKSDKLKPDNVKPVDKVDLINFSEEIIKL